MRCRGGSTWGRVSVFNQEKNEYIFCRNNKI
jgi:hypothetical protein